MEVQEIFDQRFNNFSLTLKKYIQSREIPCASTLIYQNDKILDCRVYGFKDVSQKIPLEINDVFRIASMTKPIISVAILILIEANKLSFEDKLSKFIPNTNKMKVFTEMVNNKPIFEKLKTEITILDLLTHTSGFVYPEDYTNPVDKQYKDVFNCEFLNYDENKEKMILSEFANLLPEIYLHHQPGTKFYYGISTDILGFIIEKISGEPLNTFLKVNIFDKLGLTDTDFFVQKEKMSKLVSIHTETNDHGFIEIAPDLQRSYRDKTNFLSGGAGLTSTLSDYFKFTLMLLNKGTHNSVRIVKEETIDLLLTDYTTPRGIPFSTWERDDFTDEYRRSIDPRKTDKGFCLGVKKRVDSNHFKNGIFGWFGIYGTYFWIDPDNRIIGILLSQILPKADNLIRNIINTEFEESVYTNLNTE